MQVADLGLVDLCGAAVAQARREQRTVLLSWPVGRLRANLGELRRRLGQPGTRGFYWSSPETGRQLLTLGVAWDITSTGPLRWDATSAAWSRAVADIVHIGSVPLLVGGGTYFPSGSRVSLPDSAFWVPQLQFVANAASDEAEVVATLSVRPDDSDTGLASRVSSLVEGMLRQPDTTDLPDGRLARFQQVPGYEGWSDRVSGILAAISAGRLEKVVLARSFEIDIEGRFNVGRILERLEARGEGATTFAVGWGESTFLGATPELLVHVEGVAVRTIALAGTAPRGSVPDEDGAVGRWLKASAKNAHEHTVVARYITQALSTRCGSVHPAAYPRLVRQPTVQHLGTDITATLHSRSSAAALDLVAALHPTPAVGGFPRDAAMDWQRANEPIDRGWYAGPVGWMDATGNGEFAVAIRSALVGPQSAIVYAGCGIVSGSDAHSEYVESRIKADPMLAVLVPPGAC